MEFITYGYDLDAEVHERGIACADQPFLRAVEDSRGFGGNQSTCNQLFRTTVEAASRIDEVFNETYYVSGVYSNQPQTLVKGYVDYEVNPYQYGIMTMSPEMVSNICGK
jgi:hypothetical protein